MKISHFCLLGTCPASAFKCRNKRCMLMSKVCDGVNDCVDNSDETDGCKGIKEIKEVDVMYYWK